LISIVKIGGVVLIQPPGCCRRVHQQFLGHFVCIPTGGMYAGFDCVTHDLFTRRTPPLLDVLTGRSAMGVALMLRWPRFTGETHNNRLLELNKERDERVMNKTSTLKFTQSELCSPPKGPQSQHQEIIIGNQKYAAGPARRLLGCHLYIYTPFALQVLIGWGLSTLSSCKVSN
jgi:hypothetical protein